MVTLEAVVFYLVLLDSIGANLMAWGNGKWYKKTFPWWAKRVPLNKVWCAWYLILVLWVGYSLNRLGIL
ncbi:MAG: hypothetical protein ACE5FT_03930 [Candidatus Nanoarchaeia archaeon]